MSHTALITTKNQMADLLHYCHNDVDTTEKLLETLEKEIMLRVKMSKDYGVDMRSKSDSQMAERVYIKTMGLKKKDITVPQTIT